MWVMRPGLRSWCARTGAAEFRAAQADSGPARIDCIANSSYKSVRAKRNAYRRRSRTPASSSAAWFPTSRGSRPGRCSMRWWLGFMIHKCLRISLVANSARSCPRYGRRSPDGLDPSIAFWSARSLLIWIILTKRSIASAPRSRTRLPLSRRRLICSILFRASTAVRPKS